jgi:hypothetical protein
VRRGPSPIIKLILERRWLSDDLGLVFSGPPAHPEAVFIPIYPNRLPTVPKPSTTSRKPPLVLSNLPASQGAITRLENR